ncbi:PKD domain-containing protein [Algibacillus agarilyticus]|uniref:PKD domain-containing protein n=1 Tax=Algibacillus agarilyticus TaxID=2234133 RepID=UPI0018E5926D|nr:PKD domain-containing protein [Algibacillus agarilyticus]
MKRSRSAFLYNNASIILAIIFAFILAACGGGSGFSSPSANEGTNNNGNNTDGNNNDVVQQPVNVAPTITGEPNTLVAENSPYSFTPSAVDTNNDTLRFTIQNKPSWATFSASSGQLTGTPNYEQAGVYSNIVITVSDQTQSTSLASFDIEVKNTNRLPVLQTSLNLTTPELVTHSLLLSATDPDNDPVTIALSNLPNWISFNAQTSLLTISPTVKDAGAYNNLQIRLNDGSGEQVNNTFALTITDSVSVKGKVIDGYISGAIVYLDLNLNGELDEGEPNTVTDENGNYELILSDDEITAATTAPIRSYIGAGATDSDRPDKDFSANPVTLSTSPLVNLTTDNETVDDVAVTPFTNQVVTKISGALTTNTSSAELTVLIETAENEVVEALIDELAILTDITLTDEKLTTLKTTLKEQVILGDFIAFDKTTLPTEITDDLNDVDSFVGNLQTRVKQEAQDEVDAISDINVTPIADAGEDQTSVTNKAVLLNASKSRDQNNDPLTYLWTLSTPAQSNASLSDQTLFDPVFMPDVAGTYIATLVVNDGQVDSIADSVSIFISESNIAPVAHAGADQSVSVNTTVTLNGSGSQDANGDTLTYTWSIFSPSGDQVTLINPNVVSPTFTPSSIGNYIASLEVSDGELSSEAAQINISVTSLNTAPVALPSLTIDTSFTENDTVTLTGEYSTDSEGDTLTYLWALTSPEGSSATLSNHSSMTPNFVADIAGVYTASLIVNDGLLSSTASTINIRVSSAIVTNLAPIAIPSLTSQTAYTTQEVITVSVGNSYDPENNPITYLWQLETPNSSTAILSSTTSETPSFTADVAGTYIVSLTVNDGELTSESQSLTITVTQANTAPIASASITSDSGYLVGDTVTLTGINSTDAQKDNLTYLWQLTRPDNSNAVLSDATSVSPTFIADVEGTYDVSLTVSDGQLNSDATQISVLVAKANTAPNALASILSDGGYTVGDTVNITGIASNDNEADTLTYLWVLTAPDTSTAMLTNNTDVSPSFIGDIAGTYVVSLVVNDGTIESTASILNITVAASPTNDNATPIANAGINSQVTTGETLTLDGSASSDTDNDNLTYNWVITSQPVYSVVGLIDQTAVSPQLTPDMPGAYTLSLIVNDGKINSEESTVTITAVNDLVDIKDDEFINRNDSCENYVGTYFANVTDIKNDSNFTGNVEITLNGDSCTIVSNAIPNHDFNDQTASFAHDAAEITLTYSVPVTPTEARRVKQISLGTTNAILLNGAEVDLLPAACYNEGDEALGKEKKGCSDMSHPWRYDPMFSENNFGTDANNAHTQSTGLYHYHGNPLAMFDQNCEINGVPSPVIGFAADGYPVYGLCFTDANTGNVRAATPSYQLKNNGGVRIDEDDYLTPTAGNGNIQSDNYDGQFRNDYEYVEGVGDLDECNGMEVNGQYGYYITNAFPWVLNCYKGDIDASFSFSTISATYSQKLHSH